MRFFFQQKCYFERWWTIFFFFLYYSYYCPNFSCKTRLGNGGKGRGGGERNSNLKFFFLFKDWKKVKEKKKRVAFLVGISTLTPFQVFPRISLKVSKLKEARMRVKRVIAFAEKIRTNLKRRGLKKIRTFCLFRSFLSNCPTWWKFLSRKWKTCLAFWTDFVGAFSSSFFFPPLLRFPPPPIPPPAFPRQLFPFAFHSVFFVLEIGGGGGKKFSFQKSYIYILFFVFIYFIFFSCLKGPLTLCQRKRCSSEIMASSNTLNLNNTGIRNGKQFFFHLFFYVLLRLSVPSRFSLGKAFSFS